MLETLLVYKNAALAIVFAVVLAFAGVQTYRLNTRALELQAATSSVAGLTAQLTAQDAGIAAVKSATEAKVIASKSAVVASKGIAAKAETKATSVERAPAPVGCQQAIDFLVAEVQK